MRCSIAENRFSIHAVALESEMTEKRIMEKRMRERERKRN